MRFLRFRIISLLVLVAIVAGVMAWWVQPEIVTAKASFLMQGTQGRLERLLAPDARPPSDWEITAHRETARSMLTSTKVVRAALQDPALQKTFLKKVEDPAKWIEDRLSAQFDGDSEVLEVRLEGPEGVASDLVTILRAICDAYLVDVVRAGRLDHVRMQDSLRNTHQKLSDELRQTLGEIEQLEETLGDSSKTSPELQMRRAESEMLMQSWKDLALAIQRQDVLLDPSSARESIQLVESAYIESDD